MAAVLGAGLNFYGQLDPRRDAPTKWSTLRRLPASLGSTLPSISPRATDHKRTTDGPPTAVEKCLKPRPEVRK